MRVATTTAPREAATRSNQVSAEVDGETIKLTLQADNGQQMSVALDRYEALTLMVSIGKMANRRPHDRAETVGRQKTVLKLKDPSFQVGIHQLGGIILAIRPHSFPALEFEFDVHSVSKLIDGLETVAAIPSIRSGVKH